jgi:tetratricopeptide (TPR) repeat protein
MNKKFFIILAIGFALAGCNPAGSSNPSQDNLTQSVAGLETPEAFQQRAVMLLAQGQVPAAVDTLRQSIERFPDDANAYFTLAQIYMKMGSFDNAIAACQKALEKNPDNGHVYLLMAGCYDLKNDSQKAIDLVKMSIAVFGKQNDTKNLEAATAVLEKLTTRSIEEKTADKM